MRKFDYYEPKTVVEACNLMALDGAKAVAGGTDLVVQIKRGAQRPTVVVNLKNINALKGVSSNEKGIFVGALTSITEIAESPKINTYWSSVAIGADNIGTPQVRNLGTIGGNICNSSPCADTVPGLLVADAVVVISNEKVEREVPLIEFFKGPGKNCMKNNELLKAIFLPKPPAGTKQAFFKMGPRNAADIAVINMAISLSFENGKCTRARIAMGSVAPTPIRARAAEAALEGSNPSRNIHKIAELVASAATPIDDVRGSAEYRNKMLKVAAETLLSELCKQA